MCEDHHLYYHVQSFAVSFGPRVIASTHFDKYWRAFRPISTRRWAIARGERGLTRRLLRAGFRPRIVYSAGQLVPHLRACGFGDLLEAVRLLPDLARGSLQERLEHLRLARISEPVPVIDTLARSLRRLQRMRTASHHQLHAVNVREILAISGRSLVLQTQHERWSTEAIGDAIAALVGDRNQIHFGGFLFRKYLQMPGIKRDLFYRELYSLDEIDELLGDLPQAMKEEILADLRQKGSARLLPGLSRLLYRHGSI
jgi:hypothetical protein